MQQYSERNVSISTTPTAIALANPCRVLLVIAPPINGIAAAVNPSNINVGGVSTLGLLLPSNPPLFLDRKTFGLLVTLPWYAATSQANQTVYVGEVIDQLDPFPPDADMPKDTADPDYVASGQQIFAEPVPDALHPYVEQLHRYMHGIR